MILLKDHAVENKQIEGQWSITLGTNEILFLTDKKKEEKGLFKGLFTNDEQMK